MKALWVNDLIQRREEPREVSRIAAERAFYGEEHPHAHPIDGYESSVSKVELDEAKKHYASWFRPGAATIIFTGNIPPRSSGRGSRRPWAPGRPPGRSPLAGAARPASWRAALGARRQARRASDRDPHPRPGPCPGRPCRRAPHAREHGARRDVHEPTHVEPPGAPEDHLRSRQQLHITELGGAHCRGIGRSCRAHRHGRDRVLPRAPSHRGGEARG